MERKEYRDENNVCRKWIQIKESCSKCLFDTLCRYEDNQEEIRKNEDK